MYKIGGVEVTSDFEMDESEAASYVEYVRERVKSPLKSIEVKMCADGKVDVNYEAGAPFERIRRITGYLVGTMERWNDAKQTEEHERVKHDVRRF